MKFSRYKSFCIGIVYNMSFWKAFGFDETLCKTLNFSMQVSLVEVSICGELQDKIRKDYFSETRGPLQESLENLLGFFLGHYVLSIGKKIIEIGRGHLERVPRQSEMYFKQL
jgi:hypothetical protein